MVINFVRDVISSLYSIHYHDQCPIIGKQFYYDAIDSRYRKEDKDTQ